jgi:hypothetical protein
MTVNVTLAPKFKAIQVISDSQKNFSGSTVTRNIRVAKYNTLLGGRHGGTLASYKSWVPVLTFRHLAFS